MKKHMTIAALLAAGTALSNAAIETELLWGLDFTSSSLALSTGSGTSVSGSGTISTTGGAVDGAGYYSTSDAAENILKFTASGNTSALNKQTGAFTLSFHAKWDGDSNSQWPVLASFGDEEMYLLEYKYFRRGKKKFARRPRVHTETDGIDFVFAERLIIKQQIGTVQTDIIERTVLLYAFCRVLRQGCKHLPAECVMCVCRWHISYLRHFLF